jgi:hypothetical protein
VLALAPRAVLAEDPAEGQQREETIYQLRQIGIAFHNHHDVYKRFPAPALLGGNGKPLLSWRVAILPFLGQQDLYQQFHLDEPWDSEHNKQLIERMPEVYACPASKVADQFRTVYQVPRGPTTLFAGPEGAQIRRVIDGTSKTIAVVEVDDSVAVIWTKPDDWTMNLAKPTAGLGGHFPGVFLAGAADAAAHTLPTTIDVATLKALLSTAGREPVSFPER